MFSDCSGVLFDVCCVMLLVIGLVSMFDLWRLIAIYFGGFVISWFVLV